MYGAEFGITLGEYLTMEFSSTPVFRT